MAYYVNGDLDGIMTASWEIARPVKFVPKHVEIAKQIRLPDGPMAGMVYEPRLDPVHRIICEMLDREEYTNIVGVGAVQTGKSLLLINLPFLRQCTYARNNVVYSQPTAVKLGEAWSGKILPVIQSSEFKKWLPETGQGSRGNNVPKFVRLTDPRNGNMAGMAYFIPGGGRSEAAQAAVTARVVLMDEVDSYESRHRVELIAKRADSYGRKALRVFTSTVKDDQHSIILGMYEDSTRSRIWYPCPHCNRYQILAWDNVTYDPTDETTVVETVRYCCKECGVRWTEDDRLLALTRPLLVHGGQTVDDWGKVQGPVPTSKTFGILWTALDSSLRDMSSTALNHYRAKISLERGEHGPMRSFFRDQLCQPYLGEMEEMETGGLLEWQSLMHRTQRETWGPVRKDSDKDMLGSTYSRYSASPPAEAQWAVGTFDVQHDRVYWMLDAFNRQGTVWKMAWAYEYARKDHQAYNKFEFFALLDRCYDQMRLIAEHLPVIMVGVDAGDQTAMVLEYVAGKKGPFRAVMGAKSEMKIEMYDVAGVAHYRNGIYHINTSAVRDSLHASLRRDTRAESSTRFPNGMDANSNHVFRHICAEQIGFDQKTKKIKVICLPGRHDWLDTSIYARGLMQGFLLKYAPLELIVPVSKNDPNAPQVHGDEQVVLRVRSGLETGRRSEIGQETRRGRNR